MYIQNQIRPHKRRWDHTGVVIEVRQHHQYVVRVDGSGRITVPNRQFLRRFTPSSSPASRADNLMSTALYRSSTVPLRHGVDDTISNARQLGYTRHRAAPTPSLTSPYGPSPSRSACPPSWEPTDASDTTTDHSPELLAPPLSPDRQQRPPSPVLRRSTRKGRGTTTRYQTT